MLSAGCLKDVLVAIVDFLLLVFQIVRSPGCDMDISSRSTAQTQLQQNKSIHATVRTILTTQEQDINPEDSTK